MNTETLLLVQPSFDAAPIVSSCSSSFQCPGGKCVRACVRACVRMHQSLIQPTHEDDHSLNANTATPTHPHNCYSTTHTTTTSHRATMTVDLCVVVAVACLDVLCFVVLVFALLFCVCPYFLCVVTVYVIVCARALFFVCVLVVCFVLWFALFSVVSYVGGDCYLGQCVGVMKSGNGDTSAKRPDQNDFYIVRNT